VVEFSASPPQTEVDTESISMASDTENIWLNQESANLKHKAKATERNNKDARYLLASKMDQKQITDDMPLPLAGLRLLEHQLRVAKAGQKNRDKKTILFTDEKATPDIQEPELIKQPKADAEEPRKEPVNVPESGLENFDNIEDAETTNEVEVIKNDAGSGFREGVRSELAADDQDANDLKGGARVVENSHAEIYVDAGEIEVEDKSEEAVKGSPRQLVTRRRGRLSEIQVRDQ